MGIKTFSRLDREIIERFGRLSTPTVSDAMDRIRIPGGCHGIAPIVPGKRMAGQAMTLRYVPVGVEKGSVGDYLDYAQKGDVIVIDNHSRTDCTVWGELLTVAAQKKGIEGTVIDGVCRDIPRIVESGYPMFTRGKFMVTGKDRVQLVGINEVIALSTVQVKPGDLVVGDDTGIVVVPQEKAGEILSIAEEINQIEECIEREINAGMSLTEARKRHGYHRLQRGED